MTKIVGHNATLEISPVEYIPAFTPDWTDLLCLSILADAEEERGQLLISRALREIVSNEWKPFETETYSIKGDEDWSRTFDWYSYKPGDSRFDFDSMGNTFDETNTIPRPLLRFIYTDDYPIDKTSNRYWRCFLSLESAYIALIGALITSYQV